MCLRLCLAAAGKRTEYVSVGAVRMLMFRWGYGVLARTDKLNFGVRYPCLGNGPQLQHFLYSASTFSVYLLSKCCNFRSS